MKKCPNCGSEFDDSKFFCLNCGMTLIGSPSAKKNTDLQSNAVEKPDEDSISIVPPAPPANHQTPPVNNGEPPAPPSQDNNNKNTDDTRITYGTNLTDTQGPKHSLSKIVTASLGAFAFVIVCSAAAYYFLVTKNPDTTMFSRNSSISVFSDSSEQSPSPQDEENILTEPQEEISEDVPEDEPEQEPEPAPETEPETIPETVPETEPVTEEDKISVEVAEPPTDPPVQNKRFIICIGACTWEQAEQECQEKGGHLAYIKSRQEYDEIIRSLQGLNLRYLWLGGKTSMSDGSVTASWTDGSSLDFIYDNGLWYEGEPSGYDRDRATVEPYIMLWNIKDNWSFNDNSNTSLSTYKHEYFGYICEIDE
ncbi:MAG: C-type lectin domain-containing protein [Ruminococcus sp.]|nr:C-type lectin domain-containing protein [Ruminococcus sp.]